MFKTREPLGGGNTPKNTHVIKIMNQRNYSFSFVVSNAFLFQHPVSLCTAATQVRRKFQRIYTVSGSKLNYDRVSPKKRSI